MWVCIYTYTMFIHILYTHSIYTYCMHICRKGQAMGELTVKQQEQIMCHTLQSSLYERYISFIDASPRTVETYAKAVRQLFKYLSFNGITQPGREDIVAFREELKESGHKPTTVQNYMTAVKLFFKWTSQEGYYPNIAEHLKGAKLNREHKKDYLTSKQVKQVLEQVDRTTLKGKRDYAILTLMITAGMRTIEVSRADIEDLRTLGDNTVLYVQGKGRQEKAEYIKIPAPTEKAIRDYLKARGTVEGTQPLFTSTSNNNSGSRMTTRAISGLVKEHLKGAGFDSERLTAHSLRHTAVTLSLLAGESLEEVQQFARHSNIATTMIYNHSLDKAKNNCSESISKAIFG